jgi:hypothetical protein
MVVPMAGWEGQNINISAIHSGDQLGKLVNVEAIVKGVDEKFQKGLQYFRELASKKLVFTSDPVRKLIDSVFGEREREVVMSNALHGRGQNGEQTAWALFNGATQLWTDGLNKSKVPVSRELGNLSKSEFLLGELIKL